MPSKQTTDYIIWLCPRIACMILASLFISLAWQLWDCKHRKKYPPGHGPTPEMQKAIDADPELKMMMQDLSRNGKKVVQKYLDNPEVMAKVNLIRRQCGATA
mmetsp:Transcript_86361/g.279641  ORF Transcript_86361/g.279641 Transcript_86361/m.279641 type:complete len:102 (+) Transcript_86361:64-369(+)